MKKTMILSLALVFAVFMSGTSGAQQLTGKDIAQMVHDMNKSDSGIILKGKMTLSSINGGSSESRSIILLTFRKQGLSNGLFRFTDSSYRGTTMLTVERHGKENLQYLFLPSVGSPRQIEGSDREKNFVDTDFSNEDLGGSRISDYTYNKLPDKKAGNIDCFVIERFPKSKSSKYSKHVVTIDKATLVPIEVQFYAKSGRIVKTMRSGSIKKISSSINVPMYLEVVDIEKKHKTVINISSAQEKKINRGYFNRNRLGMQWAEQ